MQRRSLVVRVWVTEEGEMLGRLQDPLSGWQQAFTAPDELWRAIAQVLALTAPSAPPTAPPTDIEPKE